MFEKKGRVIKCKIRKEKVKSGLADDLRWDT